jgi:hypothetical protein
MSGYLFHLCFVFFHPKDELKNPSDEERFHLDVTAFEDFRCRFESLPNKKPVNHQSSSDMT